MGVISNFQIENAIKKIGDEDLLDNVVGVFPSDCMNRFINHSAMIEEKKGKYPFIIANTDADNKKGTHWWSMLNTEARNELFFFDSFGLDGLKHFIIQDDRKIIDKILIGIEQMNKTDQKITLCKIKFNLEACKELSKKEIDSLSDTATDFCCFIQAFGIKLKLRSFVNIWVVEDRIQDLDSATCGIFELYFYENLFNIDKNSKIQNVSKLKRTTVRTLLNELFSLDNRENDIKMEEYADELGVKISV